MECSFLCVPLCLGFGLSTMSTVSCCHEQDQTMHIAQISRPFFFLPWFPCCRFWRPICNLYGCTCLSKCFKAPGRTCSCQLMLVFSILNVETFFSFLHLPMILALQVKSMVYSPCEECQRRVGAHGLYTVLCWLTADKLLCHHSHWVTWNLCLCSLSTPTYFAQTTCKCGLGAVR